MQFSLTLSLFVFAVVEPTAPPIDLTPDPPNTPAPPNSAEPESEDGPLEDSQYGPR